MIAIPPITQLETCASLTDNSRRNTGARKPGHPKGCHWNQRNRKWSAWIYANGRKLSLGAFERLEDAKAARSQAEAKYHGEWAYTADPKQRAAA